MSSAELEKAAIKSFDSSFEDLCKICIYENHDIPIVMSSSSCADSDSVLA